MKETEETQRKQADARLKVLMERDGALVQALAEIIYDWRPQSGELFWEGDYTRILGYSQEEMGDDTESWTSRIHPDDLEYAMAEVDEATRQRRNYDLEYRFRDKNGGYKWMQDRGVTFIDEEGVLERIIGVFSDITERKKTEEELRQTEKKYRNLIECIPAVTYTARLDETGGTLYVSPQVETLWGFSPDEWLADPDLWSNQLHPKDRERVLAEWAHSVTSGEPLLTEYRITTRDGRVCWGRDEAVIIRNDAGKPQFIHGVVLDITKHKQTEETLIESEEKYRNLIERANDGVIIAQDAVVTFVNTRLAEMFGFTVEEMTNTHFLDYVFPDDRPRIIDIYKRRTQGEDIPSLYEMAALHKDGGRFDIEVNSGIITLFGKPATLTFVRDITQRKHAEEALKDSEEKFRSVVETANDGICIVQDPIIKYLNHQLANLYGYSVEEIIGTNFAKYVHPDELEKVKTGYEKHMSGVETNQSYDTAVLNKDGRKIDVNLSTSLITFEGSQAGLALLRDITERKQADEELKQKIDELEQFNDATVEREHVMIELKKEVNTLLNQLGEPDKYKIVE